VYLDYIHFFRAISICFIVASHCINVGNWHIVTLPDRFLEAFLRNGTIFFIFISGFLFHHIYWHKFSYRKFIATRAKNVFLPYLLLSAVPIAFIIVCHDRQGHIPAFFYASPWHTAFFFILTGCTFAPYWYIPVAMMLFLASPAIMRIAVQSRFPLIIGALLLVSTIIHRPPANLNPLHNALYLLPVYLLGIYASMRRERMLAWLQGKSLLLLTAGLLLAFVQARYYNISGNFHKKFFEVTVLDINLLQKLLLIGAFLPQLRHIRGKAARILNLLADYSFPIYFIHTLFLEGIYRFFPLHIKGNFFSSMALAALLTGLSMLLAMLCGKLLGRRSRYLVGR